MSMKEIRSVWTDPSGKDLFFLGSLSDFYFLETLTGTGVTHVHKDGLQLKLLGPPVRSFKPDVPFDVHVCMTFDVHICLTFDVHVCMTFDIHV